MADDVDPNRAALRVARAMAQAATLDNLKQYVAHRAKAFEAFNRIDPNSKPARDAKARLDKARADYEAFARTMGVAPEEAEDGEAP